MVVVGLIGVVVLGFFINTAGLSSDTFRQSVLDEDEELVGPGAVTFDLGGLEVAGTLQERWIQRDRCPGWIQLNSLEGDATTVHVVMTGFAPDMQQRVLVPVDDYAAWLADEAGVRFLDPTDTTLLGVPAIAGRLTADPGANEEQLLVACREEDGSGGTGIRGPAAGFEQELVVTTEPVQGEATVMVLGAAWVSGDIDLAAAEARSLASSLEVVDDPTG